MYVIFQNCKGKDSQSQGASQAGAEGGGDPGGHKVWYHVNTLTKTYFQKTIKNLFSGRFFRNFENYTVEQN